MRRIFRCAHRAPATATATATATILALALLGCDASTTVSSDAGPDGQAEVWASDVASDVGGGDLGADAQEDALTDVGPDGLADAGPDALPDAGTWTQPFDPTVCGAAPYAWLPPADVGQVVSFEPATPDELTGDGLDALLAQAGYTGFSPVPYGARMYLLRYTTQDRGVEIEATAAVSVPLGYDPSAEPPLAMWLHGTSGFMDDCAPSRSLEGVAAAALLASLGYVTVAPDYVGMLGFGEPSPAGTIHPYLAGESVALSSWDALRATRAALASLNDGGAAPQEPVGDPARTVLWGGSQGGHAVFFVDRYQPYYAPEFHLLAAVAAVPATDLKGLAKWGMNTLGDTTVALAAAMTALRKWYTGEADMGAVLTDEEPLKLATNLPVWMSTTCKPDVDAGSLTAVTDIYTQAAIDAFSADATDPAIDPTMTNWVCYMRENSVDFTSVPRANDTPYLATFSELDELVITEVERASMERLCQQGYRIQYLECAGKGHTGGAVAALPHMKAFADARLAGEPMDPANTCVVTPAVDCEATAP